MAFEATRGRGLVSYVALGAPRRESLVFYVVFEVPRAQDEPKMAPEGLPGCLWAALGRRGRFLSDFGALWGSLLVLENR